MSVPKSLIISSTILAPYNIKKGHATLWAKAGETKWLDNTALTTEQLIKVVDQHGGDKVLIVDAISTINGAWHKVWEVINYVLCHEWRFISIREGFDITGSPNDVLKTDPVIHAMFMIAKSEAEHARAVKAARIEGRLKAAETNGQSNWILPDEKMLKNIKEDKKTMTVTAVCSKYGISRKTFYIWHKEGRLK